MDKQTQEHYERMAKKYPDVYGVPEVDDVVMIPVLTMEQLLKEFPNTKKGKIPKHLLSLESNVI
ncbi:MAG: hypothetical protein KZQ64_07610 [gamma proteobacterium symbiont of Bathyaustriella thionipta]|nr:hypothetical protein [gamma proteobacterium symbiont of Bathyaustriella thionipta]MCU7950513.1 hypothetical protein [gamma proteobacterium symbiont of Bathyaustriella thionipta]MCU7953238.1 hypothetical protein [gamma proteobacterium symbiont of Bathyaustriella thionipta]MCU7957007.1 hypothetical protein [gamma proteobacterium symbiont of Bathyaustriella thionipta]MCU7965933.1 hypothetical protein [gamma proteobacterium symbiont of Bathyaustriella thionipta]